MTHTITDLLINEVVEDRMEEMILKVRAELAEQFLTGYWYKQAEVRAPFLVFLSCKRAEINASKFLPIDYEAHRNFASDFLIEPPDDVCVNPSHYKQNQQARGRTVTCDNVVNILTNHSWRRNYSADYHDAFELLTTSGQDKVKFKPDYMAVTLRLATKGGERLSLSKVAVWLYRNKDFKPRSTLVTIKKRFREEFNISDEELEALFIDDELDGGIIIFEKVLRGVVPELEEVVEPPRKRMQVSRQVRDSKHTEAIKRLYDFRCQICGKALALPDGTRYAEAHHIRPYGAPFHGPDDESNIICVCPNDHALLDCAAIKLDTSHLRLKRHEIDKQYIDFHNKLYTEKFEAQ